MTINELISYMEDRKISGSDCFGMGSEAQQASERINDKIDDCIGLVRDFQEENSITNVKYKLLKKLLRELVENAPDDAVLAEINRYDLIEMYGDVQNLIETMDFVEQNPIYQSNKICTQIISLQRKVVVTDDWYPCVDGNKVVVSLLLDYYPNKYGNYYIKICAWGNDDTGVETEAFCQDLPTALRKFDEMKILFDSNPDGIDRNWFYRKGFQNA